MDGAVCRKVSLKDLEFAIYFIEENISLIFQSVSQRKPINNNHISHYNVKKDITDVARILGKCPHKPNHNYDYQPESEAYQSVDLAAKVVKCYRDIDSIEKLCNYDTATAVGETSNNRNQNYGHMTVRKTEKKVVDEALEPLEEMVATSHKEMRVADFWYERIMAIIRKL